MAKALATVIALLFLISACQGENAKTDKAAETEYVGYTVLAQGIQSGITEPGDYIIDNKEMLDSLWLLHYSYISVQPESPDINFDEEVVVGVFMGEKPSSGFWVRLDSIFVENGEQIVLVSANTKPEDNATLVQMATQPFFFAATTKTKHNIKIEFVLK